MSFDFLKENRWDLLKSMVYLFLGFGLMADSLVTGKITAKRGSVIVLEKSPELYWFGVAVFSLIGSYGLRIVVNVFRNK